MLPAVRKDAMRTERGSSPCLGIGMDGASEDSYNSKKTVQREIKDITEGESHQSSFLIKHVAKDPS